VDRELAKLIRALSERQEASERRLAELRASVKTLESKIAEIVQSAAPQGEVEERAANAAQSAAGKTRKAEVTPEILVMLAAAATAYLGKRVRVRSAKMLQSPYEIINPWAQQGRVFIQASHNQPWRLR
jgi:hypothetical protein